MLKRWRERKDLTQGEAAARVGVKQSAWSQWEAGNDTPRIKQILAIAKLTAGEVAPDAWVESPRRKTGTAA